MPGHGFTHCDGFSHFIRGGTTVDQMPLETWVGDAAVVDLTHVGANTAVEAADLEARGHHVRRGDIALLRTDWPRKRSWETLEFWTEAPWTSAAACRWLVARGVKAVGYDYPPDHPIRDLVTGIQRPIARRSGPPTTRSSPLGSASSSTWSTSTAWGATGSASSRCPSGSTAETAPRRARSRSSTDRGGMPPASRASSRSTGRARVAGRAAPGHRLVRRREGYRVISLEGGRDRQRSWPGWSTRQGRVPTLVGLDFPFAYAIPFLDHLRVPDFAALLDAHGAARGPARPDAPRVHRRGAASGGRAGARCGPSDTRRQVERVAAMRGAESPLRALPQGSAIGSSDHVKSERRPSPASRPWPR